MCSSSFSIRVKHLSIDQRQKVRIVLPELTLPVNQGGDRYRLLIDLRKSQGDQTTWQVSDRQAVVRVEPSHLARLLERKPAADLIARMSAANWLSETGPGQGGEALARLNPSWEHRRLQLSCLQLLSMRNRAGQEERALSLLQDSVAPSEYRKWAAVYLGVRHYKPALEDLVLAAKNANAEVAIGAIHGLGAFGGKKAAMALLAMLSKPPQRDVNPERVRLIADLAAQNLVFTKFRSPDIFEALTKLVQRKNQAALNALVASGYPESLPFFRDWASEETRSDYKGGIALALLASGGDEAIPDVLEMLKKDDPPAGDNLTVENDLVRALQVWASSHGIPVGLLALARSNWRAAQVLAGSGYPGAEFALTNLDVEEVAFIALHALATRWPDQPKSVGHFRMAIAKYRQEPTILVIAIQGLANSGSQEVVADLTPLLNDPNVRVSKEAELALAKLKRSNKSAP